MRYVEAFPEELDAAWERGAVALIPFGALEWHGNHLPLGLDGILAESFAERLAQKLDGVLLPTFYTPITTLPHKHSLQVPTDCFRSLLDALIGGLYKSGARTIALVTGHYAQGHEIELYEAALRSMEDFAGLRVFAATPLEPLRRDELLDHAGRYETSQFLALKPELVRVDRLSEMPGTAVDSVLGTDPRLGSAEEGQQLLGDAEAAWLAWLTSDSEALREHYKARFDAYQPYVDMYFKGSWEEAIEAWWSSKVQQVP